MKNEVDLVGGSKGPSADASKPRASNVVKTAAIADDAWKPGSPVKALCQVPEATTVHGSNVQVMVNGQEVRGLVEMTFDQFDATICAIRERQRGDFISKFGDPDVPRRGITINVATLPGR